MYVHRICCLLLITICEYGWAGITQCDSAIESQNAEKTKEKQKKRAEEGIGDRIKEGC